MGFAFRATGERQLNPQQETEGDLSSRVTDPAEKAPL